ncbi:allophanate hydrolase [Dickeya dianthicola]|uniref:allophanate hydrolase n=1 Tax=Dickeya dianthicola TaxID=204039 RepID=UPI00136B2591|nr:allophanate hydrolase [Dickeya dianthicola]MCI4236736.1 allophanate hydrolase [Dickeya dianthicola]MCI4255048.1 allophanate hydrolase [Dickeya dianthicola]MZG21550.1 allophanate hydrolase [Dickeya dianthicola]MZI90516.1 allophanate hydrolase [Dickeya dianthicola]
MTSQTAYTGFTLPQWQRRHQQHPDHLTETLLTVWSTLRTDDPAWIYLADETCLREQITGLLSQPDAQRLPLYGIPFAVKDNVDVAGWPTSAACPAFTYTAAQDATVVARLKAAGAIVPGKTNLDQFATGLVGTRSPFGAVPNSFNSEYVSGGSSSGSASVVARGLVPFALGTDTAGSGRVPAGFNNIVGLKPTKGWLSTQGVVPACRLNDCVSVFALTVQDAWLVATLAGGYDEGDAYSRHHPRTTPATMSAQLRLAVPHPLEFFGDRQAEQAFQQALSHLQAIGATLEPLDFSPFEQLARQLYNGPWVAERTVAAGKLLHEQPEAMDPIVRGIIAKGADYSACEVFEAEYLRAELARQIAARLSGFDALVVPTAPTIHTQEEMKQQPVAYNSQFGFYTNFTNLADLCGLALPAPFRDDGLPAGITLIAPAWHDAALAAFGRRWQSVTALPLGATGKTMPPVPVQELASPHHVRLAVVGAHLSGMPLNFQLLTRNAVKVEDTVTSADYRLYALANTQPPKPGLVNTGQGQPIVVELWDVPLARFGELVAEIPAPLGIGTLTLADGRQVKGFICEPAALNGARDITEFGGWRAFVTQRSPA